MYMTDDLSASYSHAFSGNDFLKTKRKVYLNRFTCTSQLFNVALFQEKSIGKSNAILKKYSHMMELRVIYIGYVSGTSFILRDRYK